MVTKIRKILLIAVISIIHAPSIWAQGVIIYKSDGTTDRLSYAAIDSIVTYADYKDEGGGQEEEDGTYEAVDLGLSVKWATCNIGATSPEQYGDYFAWGETEPKSDSSYCFKTYSYWTDFNNDGKRQNDEYTNIGFNISKTQYDVATVKWENGWRMPTDEEIEELGRKCTREWISVNGIYGYKMTASNGNSIFLPAAGLYGKNGRISDYEEEGVYWSASTEDNTMIKTILISKGYYAFISETERSFGLPVRPVRD